MAEQLQHITGSAVVLLAAGGSALPHSWRCLHLRLAFCCPASSGALTFSSETS